ncbi:hypothetical protein GCM10011339_13840 [Echinicola rosea]|uniref:Histone deacetylase domain-containing protein n=1 Tax=Echinicola rosea TaxID=1807691 RepID=A0ABQ1UV30_9BACT|nr:hypothetical protein GCM10011339_13840 [Echinicola rosea]
MEKYELLPQQLLYEGTITQGNLFEPRALDRKWIIGPHKEGYLQKLTELTLSKSEIRKTGFPMSAALVEREVHIMDGSVQACLFALENGIAMNVAGGTHHAFSDKGGRLLPAQ